MRNDYDSNTKDKPDWKVGDVIHSGDNLCLVARIADLDNRVSGHHLYILVNLESGYSSDSYETIAELQHHTYDTDDRVVTGTFKVVTGIFKHIDDDK